VTAGSDSVQRLEFGERGNDQGLLAGQIRSRWPMSATQPFVDGRVWPACIHVRIRDRFASAGCWRAGFEASCWRRRRGAHLGSEFSRASGSDPFGYSPGESLAPGATDSRTKYFGTGGPVQVHSELGLGAVETQAGVQMAFASRGRISRTRWRYGPSIPSNPGPLHLLQSSTRTVRPTPVHRNIHPSSTSHVGGQARDVSCVAGHPYFVAQEARHA
jgi:hypothetical protein